MVDKIVSYLGPDFPLFHGTKSFVKDSLAGQIHTFLPCGRNDKHSRMNVVNNVLY